MRLKNKIRQSRRDFTAVYECEHCGAEPGCQLLFKGGLVGMYANLFARPQLPEQAQLARQQGQQRKQQAVSVLAARKFLPHGGEVARLHVPDAVKDIALWIPRSRGGHGQGNGALVGNLIRPVRICL